MHLWRLCKRRWARAPFSGEGARRSGGRWNHKGTALVYSSPSLSLASIEFFVHLQPEDAPDDLLAVELIVPEEAGVLEIALADLPRNWRDYPAPAALKDIGTNWGDSQRTLLLSVPSAVIPRERNILINPVHREIAACTVGTVEPFRFDSRMWKSS